MHRHELIQRRRQLRQDMAELGVTGTLPPLPTPTERDLLIAALYFATDPRPARAEEHGVRCRLALSRAPELARWAGLAPCGGVLVSDTHPRVLLLAIKPHVLDEVLIHLVAFAGGVVQPQIYDDMLTGDYRPLSADELAEARTLVED